MSRSVSLGDLELHVRQSPRQNRDRVGRSQRAQENGKTLPVSGNLFPRPSAGRTSQPINPCVCAALPPLFGDVLDASWLNRCSQHHISDKKLLIRSCCDPCLFVPAIALCYPSGEQTGIPFPAPRDGREKKSPTKGVLDYWNAAMADFEGPGDEAG